MKIKPEDFNRLVEQALQTDTNHLRPVIEKELLHYDLLFCLDRSGLLDQLVFQGGTSLRLCHGGNRFSEDLDFAGGPDFTSHQLTQIKECIEDYISARYSLEVTVKEPSSLRKEPEYAELKIDKWQVAVVTAPERKDLPRQRIKIEIASIPAYSRQPLPLKRNYDFLPDGYQDTLIYTETLDEIMADKLIALPATQKYIRHRDIWDLAWLQQQGAQINLEWVRNKVQDYRLADFEERLNQRLATLDEIIAGQNFSNEMRRFLPDRVYQRTLGQKKFIDYLQHSTYQLLDELRSKLYGEAPTLETFKM